jgi:hypothetical protein
MLTVVILTVFPARPIFVLIDYQAANRTDNGCPAPSEVPSRFVLGFGVAQSPAT